MPGIMPQPGGMTMPTPSTSAPAQQPAMTSEIARALMGGHVGDVVTWRKPSGAEELEILSIRRP